MTDSVSSSSASNQQSGLNSLATEQRKKIGEFAATGSAREVIEARPDNKIPGPDPDSSENTTLDEWEISAQDVEKLYLSEIEQLKSFKPEGKNTDDRARIAKQIEAIRIQTFQLISCYNKRLGDLFLVDRIIRKNQDTLSKLLKVEIQAEADRLSEFAKCLSGAKKNKTVSVEKVVNDVLAIIPNLDSKIKKFKAELSNATLPEPPSKPARKSQKPEPKPTEAIKTPANSKLENLSISERIALLDELHDQLQTGTLRLGQSNTVARDAAEILSRLMHASQKMIKSKESLDDAELQELLNRQLSLANAYQQIIEIGDLGKLSKTDKSTLVRQLAIASQSLKDIQNWKPGQAATKPLAKKNKKPKKTIAKAEPAKVAPEDLLKPAELKSNELRACLEEIKEKTNPDDRRFSLQNILRYTRDMYKTFSRLTPLFLVANTKSKRAGIEPNASITKAQDALNDIEKSLSVFAKAAVNADFIEALREADKSIAELKAFDKQLPSSVWELMTSTLPTNAGMHHYLENLLCRRCLSNFGDGLSKQDFRIFDLLQDHYKNALNENEPASIYQSFQSVLNEVFSNPDKVRALTEQVRDLREVQALALLLPFWPGLRTMELNEVYKKLVLIRPDHSFPAIEEGKEKIDQLLNEFEKGTDAVTQECLQMLSQNLRDVIRFYVRQRINNPDFFEKFKTDKTYCKNVQEKMNKTFDDIAVITVNPGGSDNVNYKVELLQKSPIEFEKRINDFINQESKASQFIRTELLKINTTYGPMIGKRDQKYHLSISPSAMLQQFSDDFSNNFSQYDEALRQADMNKADIDRYATIRKEIPDLLRQVGAQLKDITSIKGKKKSNNIRQCLGLRKQVANDIETPRSCKDMLTTLDETRQLVFAMMTSSEIHSDQGLKTLQPLFKIIQILSSRDADTKPRLAEGEVIQEPESFSNFIVDMENRLMFKWLHRLFGSKRYRALEHAKALSSICQKCSDTPEQAASLLSNYSSYLIKNSPDISDRAKLGNAMSDYAHSIRKQILS